MSQSAIIQVLFYLVDVQGVAAASDAFHLLHGLSRHDLCSEIHQV